jgi:pyrroloquinoline quinone (PQQ) biosynthesis protein C
MELCERIDEARRRGDVLQHPFYERWECGELTREELAFYAGEYRHAVVALARAAAASGDDEHAREEAGHVALWDEFAAAVDAPLDRTPTPETSECATAWSQDERFRALYGFDADDTASAYFRLHAELDVEHARAAREALADAPPSRVAELAAAAERALEANWRLLDGVERAS